MTLAHVNKIAGIFIIMENKAVSPNTVYHESDHKNEQKW